MPELHPRSRRLVAGIAAAVLTIGLAAAPAAADSHRRGRHHGGGPGHRREICLAQHGFGRLRPLSDFRDPALRARFVQALRDCGYLPPVPAGPTTSTTTSPPIITS